MYEAYRIVNYHQICISAIVARIIVFKISHVQRSIKRFICGYIWFAKKQICTKVHFIMDVHLRTDYNRQAVYQCYNYKLHCFFSEAA